MPRIRSIKPEITTDRKFAGVSRAARYTFVMLIAQSDDDGLILGSPRQLLGTLYPHDDDVTLATLSRELRELLDLGIIRERETTDGAPVIEISNWTKHQKIDHKGKSLILPLLTPFSCEPRESLAKPSRKSRAPTLDLGSGSTTLDRGSSSASASDATKKRTWLTPIEEVWTRRFGPGTFPFKQHAKALSDLYNRDEPMAEVARRLENYLAVTDAQFVSVPKFVQTYGDWATAHAKSNGNGHGHTIGKISAGRAALKAGLEKYGGENGND